MNEKNYLGVMLDCSRNAVMSVEELKRFIQVLEKAGYNCLQLYTEDTYEIEGEPLFGYRRGRYTKEELKEIDAFAAAHGIELMPCIQTLAHLNQIFRYPKYGRINDAGDVLLAEDESTYELIDKMLKTCAECFTSRNIHIGMDEAHLLGRGKYLDEHGEKSRFDILLPHLNRVAQIAEKYGFKPMIWSDMFFRIACDGEYYHKKPIPKEVREKVPQNVQLVYWDYYNEDEELLESMTAHHLDFNRKVWIAGGAWKWCGFQSDNKKSLAQTEKFIRAAKQQGVNDILITLWGDNGGECSPYAVLPSLVYAAECARGNFDVENAKRKFESLFSESWDDFMLCDLPCAELFAKTDFRLGVKEMLYSDYFLSSFDCCVLGTGEESKAYEQFAKRFAEAAKRSANYAYLFESYAALSRALAVKYDLGYRTRKAYEQGDKTLLAALVSDYEKTLTLLEEFSKTYEKQWMQENKPHGFDVQDIRLGGIIQRTKSCMRRLKAYLGGEISKIDELEEPDVDFSTGEAPKRNGIWYNCYQVTASANVL